MMLVLYYLNMVQFEGLITLVLAVEHSAKIMKLKYMYIVSLLCKLNLQELRELSA